MVFPSQPSADLADPVVVTQSQSQSLDGPWNIQFPPDHGAPDRITLTELQGLHQHEMNGVRHFSGVASYQTTLRLTTVPAGATLLDLGSVHDLASLRINGHALGGRFCAPYRFVVPDRIWQVGDNLVEIDVANTWFNRLVGDDALPADVPFVDYRGGRAMQTVPAWGQEGKHSPNQRVTFSSYLPGNVQAEAALRPAGLIGPVILHW